jgi:peptide/nickel transport system substrate-binding protein
MKKFRWQILILCITGLVVGALLLLERQGGFLSSITNQPVQGGVYTEALVGSLQRLNPLIDSGNPADRDLDRLIFSGLVRFDSRGIAEGDVAKNWGVSEDGTIYNIELRDDVLWHDGAALTTSDVVFTVNMISRGGDLIPADLSEFWASIKVIKLDDTHMQFVLPEAFAPFLDYLTFGILPEHIYGGMTYDEIVASTYNLQPIGSGPYMYKDLALDGNTITGITLEVNQNYYGSVPYIEEIVFRYYADAQSAYQAYQDGYVQGISEVTNDILPQVLENENLSLYSARLPQISMVLLNLDSDSVSFFQEVKVRKALLLGINRQQLINEAFNGQAIQADGVIFPGTWAYMEGTPTFSYDPDQARDLLKQAGYVVTGETDPVRANDGVELKFVLSYPDDELHAKLAQMIQSDWKALDVVVTLEPVPADQFVADKLESRGYQAALVDINLSNSPDPDPYPFWDQAQIAGGQNYSQWNDRTVSDTLEQARVAIDLVERTRLYHNFQYLFADQLPALPLYYPVYNYAVDNQVNGVSIGPLFSTSDRFANITSWNMVFKRTSTNSK